MSKIYLLPAADRAIFFNEAFAQTQIPIPIIEKDFWVVWTLDRLFAIEDLKTHLTSLPLVLSTFKIKCSPT